jgi:hypothetical protein
MIVIGLDNLSRFIFQKIQDKAVHAKFKEKVGSIESHSSYDNK